MAADEKTGSTSEATKEPDAPVDEGKRTFLKIAVVASGLLAAGAAGSILRSVISPSAPPESQTAPTSFPRYPIPNANVATLAVATPIIFNYPLDDEPNVLVKLGQPATNGIGPDRDIVAFSLICQHLGCIWGFLPTSGSPPCNPSYKAPEPAGYCCCHGSVFDLTNAARVIGGPSPRPQPQVTLEVDTSGAIYAVGMGTPTIFGHNTGSSDVTADLQGGTPVG
jgi:arsenite oxidase small subunit